MAINLGTIFAQIGLDITKLRAGVSKAKVQITKADRSIGGFVKRNEKKLLAFGAAGAGAVLAIGIASVKMAGNFDQAMRNVNTITKLSEKQFLELKEEVIDLSREVPLTVQELTDGLFNVASAGVEAADQMNFLAESSRAAVAGQADLATTVKGLTGVIKGYGEEFSTVDKVADLFFKTNELGVTTFEELAASMGLVVPIAASLGVTQEELFASMATLTGVTGNTSQVVTQLKAAFTNLVKPSKEAQEIAEKLGISFNATSIETLGLQGFLAQLSEKTGGNVETMGKLFGSVEGLNAILALTGSSSDKFVDNLGEMETAGGAMADAFSEQQKGLNNQIQILKNNIEAIALDIGSKIIPALTRFTTNINELDQDTKDNITTVAEWGLAFVGTLGSLVLLVKGVSLLKGTFTALKAFAGGLGGTITGLFGSVIIGMLQVGDSVQFADDALGRLDKRFMELTSAGPELKKFYDGFNDSIETNLSEVIKLSEIYPIAAVKADKLFRSFIDGNISAKDLDKGLKDLAETTNVLKVETDRWTDSQASARLESGKITKSTIELGDASKDAAKAIQEEADALENLVSSLFKTFLFNADLTGSLRNSEAAFDDVTEAQNEFGIGSEEADEAVVNLALALDAQAEKLPDIISKVGDLTEEELKFLQATKDNIEKAIEFGIVEEDVWTDTAAIINKKISDEILTDFLLMTMGMTTINDTVVDPEITADTKDAEKNLGEVIDLISRIKDKKVTITTVRRFQSFGVPGGTSGSYTGGLVRGFASGGNTSQKTVLIGERGPELATLPLGTRITPNNQLGQVLEGGEGQTINLNVKAEVDGETLFNIVESIQNKEDFRKVI